MVEMAKPRGLELRAREKYVMRIWTSLAATLLILACPHRAEASDAWRSIFDGHTLKGWTPKIAGHAVGDNYHDTFVVKDGAIRVSYAGYGSFENRFGHLFYKTPFKAYRLRLDYRLLDPPVSGAPAWGRSNSGVMFHAQPPGSMARDQWFPVSLEFQILGRDGEAPRPTGSVCTPGTNITFQGERLKGHCATSTGPTIPNGTWTALELEVRANGEVLHKINGQTVLSYSNPELDLLDLAAEPRVAAQGGNLRLEGGYIALQGEGHPIEFKNIEILELH